MGFRLSTTNLDTWDGDDKVKHLGVSAFMAMALCFFLPPEQALSAALGVGLAKEIYDGFNPQGSGFSIKDLVADAIGVLVGYAVHIVAKYLVAANPLLY